MEQLKQPIILLLSNTSKDYDPLAVGQLWSRITHAFQGQATSAQGLTTTARSAQIANPMNSLNLRNEWSTPETQNTRRTPEIFASLPP